MQHPIPQNISAYEFRLVGDMTLKQFFQLAGGVVVALIIYATPLPSLIKWPLVVFFSLLGVALAFFPFQERPLATWIISFFKAAYSPTIYTWQAGRAEEVFAEEAKIQEPAMITPMGKKKAEEYLAKIPQPRILQAFEEAEQNFFQKIAGLFQHVQHAPAPPPTQGPLQAAVPEEMQIPPSPPVYVEPEEGPKAPPPQAPQTYRPQKISPVFAPQPAGDGAQKATFSAQAAPPAPPEKPNTIVGQVQGSDGKLVEAAILEIKDSNGRPVRAMKTNKLGHFMTATPLADGEYQIETEKEGLEFGKVKFVAKGEVIEPILIKASQSERAGEQESVS